MKTNQATAVKPLHLSAAVILLFYAILQLERGGTSSLFFFAGITALLVSLSRTAFLSRPGADALVLWFEAVCMGIAAFKSFSAGKLFLPWIFAGFAVFYAYQGYRQSGLK